MIYTNKKIRKLSKTLKNNYLFVLNGCLVGNSARLFTPNPLGSNFALNPIKAIHPTAKINIMVRFF